MNILVVGLNHKTADIEVREKIAFDGHKLSDAFSIMSTLSEIKENIILSTCNRVEVYANVKDADSGAECIKKFLSDFHNIPRETLDKSLYAYDGRNAIRHIYRVASSLDSMVVGEPQILGQLKDAFEFALKRKSTGVFLNRLMKKTLSVAKRIRTETKIAESAVSISFAAVELAKKIFEDLHTKSFMLMGAGEMAELAAGHLINNGVKDVLVTNRTYERAEEIAKEFNGKAVKFDEFLQELVHTDIVICSTGAPHYILLKEQMHKIMKQRKNRPVFIIDISVPRNIDPEINNLDNVYLYNVDDLKGIVNTNIQERSREAEKAEKIVDEEIEAFLKWQKSLSAVPTIVALRDKAEAIRKDELEKTLHKLSGLGEKDVNAIEALTNSIVNKLVHFPTTALKSEAEDKDAMIDIVNRIFGLSMEAGGQSDKSEDAIKEKDNELE
ncbi:MAG: glutamyl-tRNA reductase [Nitrospirae bacterium]|nr:glutamyl-tRNA reductase [Nitrospirota bacterium]